MQEVIREWRHRWFLPWIPGMLNWEILLNFWFSTVMTPIENCGDHDGGVMHACMHVSLFLCMHLSSYVCMHVCVCVCVCVAPDVGTLRLPTPHPYKVCRPKTSAILKPTLCTTLGASKCMHVVHSVGFGIALVIGRHTLWHWIDQIGNVLIWLAITSLAYCHFKLIGVEMQIESQHKHFCFLFSCDHIHSPNHVITIGLRMNIIYFKAHSAISLWHVCVCVCFLVFFFRINLDYKPCHIPLGYRWRTKKSDHTRPTKSYSLMADVTPMPHPLHALRRGSGIGIPKRFVLSSCEILCGVLHVASC